MNYEVIWTTVSLNQLAELWLNSDDRPAIVSASQRIDVQLRNDPFEFGESRDDRFRIGFELPLRIMYTVSTPLARVWVVSVAAIPKN